jgi:hypothetical protein
VLEASDPCSERSRDTSAKRALSTQLHTPRFQSLHKQLVESNDSRNLQQSARLKYLILKSRLSGDLKISIIQKNDPVTPTPSCKNHFVTAKKRLMS